MDTETIAAIATAPGVGGVGIIRVSGPLVGPIAAGIVGPLPRPRYAAVRPFRAADGSLIDEGIVLYFPGPRSFTGEDVLEIQGHGGPVVLDLLLKRCLQLGARLARPGEFSERAFLNGKLDLVQAEAVADLIESSTTLAARLAVRSLQGAFSARIQVLIEALILLRTFVEATLDFPDEEIDVKARAEIAAELRAVIASAQEVLSQAQQGERIRDGLTVVIAGRPNAGKSSLLNALAQADLAIVTPIPGTTRDLLRSDIQVDGLPLRIIDTAGLHESLDLVEQEGVRRARQQLAQADLILWVYDQGLGLDPQELAALPADIPLTLVRNKIDQEPTASADPGPAHPAPEVRVSARTGQGIDRLREHLKTRAGVTGLGEGSFVARRRHLDALRRALTALHAADSALEAQVGPEIVALELAEAQQALGEITGVFTPDDLLGRIFSTFCIGK